MRNKLFILSLTLIMLFGGSNESYSFQGKNVNVFNEIVTELQGNIEEYGLRTVIHTKEESEAYCLELLKKLNIKEAVTSITKEDSVYSIEFNGDDTYGYIENMNYDNYNVVTINIAKKANINGIDDLKELIERALGENHREAKYFQYLKAQFSNKDIYKANESIETLLKQYGASDIETVEIENGYSSTAYTGKYPPVKTGGRHIDFNYALCSYTSGSYVIIGTPIITAAY